MENNQVMPILSFIISTGTIKKFIGGILMGCFCSLLVVGNDAHALSESNRGNRLSTDQFVLSSSYQKLRRVLTKNASLGQLPSITKDGYAFLGWYKEKSYTNKVSSTTTIGSDITLYAKLQKCGPYERVDANVASNSGESKCVDCAVVLDGNGGTPKCYDGSQYKDMPLSFTGGACGTEANLSSIYEQSHYCTIEAQREGYLFSGWYTAPSGGTSVSQSHMVYGNTYYAQWKDALYCTQTGAPSNAHYINTNVAVTSPKNCEWECNAGFQNVTNMCISTCWEELPHGGAGGTAIPPENPYYGLSWRDLNGQDWEYKCLDRFKITLNMNGGTCLVNKKGDSGASSYSSYSIVGASGSLISSFINTINSCTKNGYTFDGRYTKQTGGTKITNITNEKFDNTKTYYAHWNENTNTSKDCSDTLENIMQDGYYKNTDEKDKIWDMIFSNKTNRRTDFSKLELQFGTYSKQCTYGIGGSCGVQTDTLYTVDIAKKTCTTSSGDSCTIDISEGENYPNFNFILTIEDAPNGVKWLSLGNVEFKDTNCNAYSSISTRNAAHLTYF